MSGPALPPDFERLLRSPPLSSASALGEWLFPDRTHPVSIHEALSALADVAVEAVDLPDGQHLLTAGVPVTFRTDLHIRHLGECRSEDGARFDAFLLTIGLAAEVIVWLEDDLHRNCVAYRGAAGAVEQAGLEAKLFKGGCLAGSTEADDEIQQHIVRVRR